VARKPVLSQRCKTHNTRIDPDAGVIDVPGSGAINEIHSEDGFEAVEHEFSCGCVIQARLNRLTGSFDTSELNDRKEPV
jgi:hypothetical protein